jgi:hypothetical protein
MKKRFVSISLVVVFLCCFFPVLAQEDIQIAGKIWNPGFFEVGTSIAGNDEYIYVCDTNNAQVQAYDTDFRPYFHFGGYGSNNGQFISLQGIQTTEDEIFVTSIHDYKKNEGRIQVFSKTGIYQRSFEKPTTRSDFIRTSPVVNDRVYAITKSTLCTFEANGSLLFENDTVDNLSFLDLKDIDISPQNILLVDCQRRGFMMVDWDLSSVRVIGEELISIPVAIEHYNNTIFVADAKGNVFTYSAKGKHLSTILSQENLLVNSLYYAQEDTLYATTTRPHSIMKMHTSTLEVSIMEMRPASPLELHWPSTICVNGEGLLYTNDDVTRSIKCIQSKTNEFIAEMGRLNEESSSYIFPSDLCTGHNDTLYVIDLNKSNQIYSVSQSTSQLFYKGTNSSHFTHIQYIHPFLYTLDQYNQCIHQISVEGTVEKTFSFQDSMKTIQSFYASEGQLTLLNHKGIIFILDTASGSSIRSFSLQNYTPSSTAKIHFIPLDNRVLVVNRDKCCVEIYNNRNGILFSNYGSIGGPNTFIQDSNAQVNLWFETGLFLFPEKMILYRQQIVIADAGNHRIQFIPLSRFLQTVIELQIHQRTSFVNGEEHEMDVAPYISNGRTMVPLRFVSEAFQAEVQWNSKLQEISIQDRDTTIVLTIGSNKMRVNDNVITLDVPPVIRTSRTFVPIRAISEALQAAVEWNAANQTVTIRRM